jgi:HSP20 family protein
MGLQTPPERDRGFSDSFVEETSQMTLMRRAADRRPMQMRDPFREVMESWFGAMPDPFDGFGGTSSPAIDLRETDDSYIVEVELPGIRPEDTEVVLDGRTLTIRGEFNEEREEPVQAGDNAGRTGAQGARTRYLLRERRRGSFMRVLTLPAPVDADHITSRFENGELMLTLPKAQQARARHIEIRGASRDAGQSGQQQGSQQGSQQSASNQSGSGQSGSGQESSNR